MLISELLPTIVGATVVIILLLFYMRRAGRLKNTFEVTGAIIVIIGGACAIVYYETRANSDTQSILTSMFEIKAGEELLAFNRTSGKGRRTSRVEAIYQLNGYRVPAVSLKDVSFLFKKTNSISEIRHWTIDRFGVVDKALAWLPLPRAYSKEWHFPGRRVHSRSRTPSEADMMGVYLCAFVTVDAASAERGSPQQVMPCQAVAHPAPSGITILALINEVDETLHIQIE